MYDDLTDLVTGSCCLGCGRGGRLLCPRCVTALPTTATPASPVPRPDGLAACWTTGPYDAMLRDLVLGHKEHGLLRLVEPLGLLLAMAVAAAVPHPSPVLLVPVPSRAASLRARGQDPTYAMTRAAARQLRAVGYAAVTRRMLAVRRTVADQAGLASDERAANLQGAFWCPSSGLAGIRRYGVRGPAIVCDDVLTTGSTAREAQRALESVGIPVVAIATVAATRRRAAGQPLDSSGRLLVMFEGTD